MARHKNSATTGGKRKFVPLSPTTMAKGAKRQAKNTSDNVSMPPAAHSTRSKSKAVSKPVGSADTDSIERAENTTRADMNQKRKRAMTNLSEQGADTAPKKRAKGSTVRKPSRIAPARPLLKLSQGSDSEHEDQASDGVTSSDVESGELTAKQLNAERPTPVRNGKQGATMGTGDVVDAALDTGKVGRRAQKVLDEIPIAVQQQPPIEDDNQDTNLNFDTTPPVVTPVATAVPTPATVPANIPHPATVPPPLPQPGNDWPAVTNLVARGNGRLQQSAQSREISKYVSKTIRLANFKVFFVDAFPDPETQNKWLGECLITVLKEHAPTENVASAMNSRAQHDPWYMPALISMMIHRWCNARQMVIDAARVTIDSEECTYGIKELGREATATKVAELLHEEAFHFPKGNSGPQKGAPYQNPEIAACIAHFFKGRGSYGVEYSTKIPRGEYYGLLMPPPMVALVTTAMGTALAEWKTGVEARRSFTETDHRETYRGHLAAMKMVEDSDKSASKERKVGSKYERMLSTIYSQTMKYASGTATAPTPAAPKKQVIDIDAMEE